jgi:hypothetical protein
VEQRVRDLRDITGIQVGDSYINNHIYFATLMSALVSRKRVIITGKKE